MQNRGKFNHSLPNMHTGTHTHTKLSSFMWVYSFTSPIPNMAGTALSNERKPPPQLLPPVRNDQQKCCHDSFCCFYSFPFPPAVLVRFLTRRFIGEYASNTSKCFQIWCWLWWGGGRFWTQRTAFIFRYLYICEINIKDKFWLQHNRKMFVNKRKISRHFPTITDL